MVFAYDTEWSLRSAVALVNSAEDPDTLTTVAQLEAWYDEHGFTGRHDSDEAELESLRALRPVLRELLTAIAIATSTETRRASGASEGTAWMCQSRPSWRRSCGTAWASASSRLTRSAARSRSIDLIRTDELSRLAVCTDDRCDGLVLDLSRNRS